MDTAIILGNGPSLRGFDFINQLKGYITFGCNAAYRYWDQINWYPDYYGCLDVVVGLSHKKEIGRLIECAEKYGIKKFLLRRNLIVELGDIGKNERVVDFDTLRGQRSPYWGLTNQITTGSHITAWAASLGFKNILLLGIDSNYVEHLPEARSCGGYQLEIIETPTHNPNYFFDDYQQVGDKYNIPNVDPMNATHRVSWEALAPAFVANDVLVVNANMKSSLTTFYKMPLEETVDFIQRQRAIKVLLGPFPVSSAAKFDETNLVRGLLGERTGTLIEVGAHFGSETLLFLKNGWKVYAFEPDDHNRETLLNNTASFSRLLTVDRRAVSNVSGLEIPFYTSKKNTGISSLIAFDKSHCVAKKVQTISLNDYIKEHDIDKVDFLKVDVEGYDGLLLQAFPFEKIKPDFILCEFEDRKTVPLGYTMKDMADFLFKKGYTIYVSEWYPIISYGTQHKWFRLYRYPGLPASPQAWGNLIAVRKPINDEGMGKLAQQCINFYPPTLMTTAPITSVKNKKKKKYKEHLFWLVAAIFLILASLCSISYFMSSGIYKIISIFLDILFWILLLGFVFIRRTFRHLKTRLRKVEEECRTIKRNLTTIKN